MTSTSTDQTRRTHCCVYNGMRQSQIQISSHQYRQLRVSNKRHANVSRLHESCEPQVEPGLERISRIESAFPGSWCVGVSKMPGILVPD